MAVSLTLAVGLKTLFLVLFCITTAATVYTIVTDGLPFRRELLTPWMAATLVDFYINVLAIGAWVIYKQTNWISAIIWVVFLICFGSITTCVYIILQLFNLSPQESLQDPIYSVLTRDRRREVPEQRRTFSVTAARVLFIALGCLMLVTLLYTLVTDGSPFRKDVLTPWMSQLLVEFYVIVMALSVWIAYKEPSWIRASCWIVLLVCFGSISTCAYISVQLFQLSSQDPVYLILFNSSNRSENGYEKTSERQKQQPWLVG